MESTSTSEKGRMEGGQHKKEQEQPHSHDEYEFQRWDTTDEGYSSSDLFEITEGLPLSTIRDDVDSSLFSYDVFNAGDSVYVAVGNTETSVDALSWTLKNAVFNSSTTLFLVHVYPEIRLIPSPLGMLPKSQVSPELVERHIAQERTRRRKLLQKYLNMCSDYRVKVETLLVESDMVGKAILELIPIINIGKLVLGMSDATLRKIKSRRGLGIADQVLLNAPQTCDITVICQGKQVLFDQLIDLPSPSPEGSDDYTFPNQNKDHHAFELFSCCFRPKVLDS